MKIDIKGKKILITGSSKGLGFGMCEKLLAEGCHVIMVSSNKKNLNLAMKKLGENNIYYYKADLTKKRDITGLIKFTKNKFNFIDLLVSNLGSGKFLSSNSNNEDEWRRLFEINFWSSFNIITNAQGILKKNKSSIVCISSIVSNKNVIGAPIAYSSSKNVLNTFVKRYAVKLSEKGIRINIISPGNILFSGSTWDNKLRKNKKDTIKYIKKNVPLNKFGDIDDISSMIVYLASDKSKFITGSEFVIDGGQSIL